MTTPIIKTESNTANTRGLSAKEINKLSSTSSILHDGNNVYYSLSEYEFKAFKKGTSNSWENLTIFFLGLFIPSILIVIEKRSGPLDLSLFAYCLVAVISFILSVVFGYNWLNTKNHLKEIIECVERKPPVKLSK